MAELNLSISGEEARFGPDEPFVRDLFEGRTRPVSFWLRCNDDDFDLGFTLVTPGEERVTVRSGVVWFRYDGTVGEYTGLEEQSDAAANARLD